MAQGIMPHRTVMVRKNGITDNSATNILTCYFPNENCALGLRIVLLATMSVGTDAFESSRIATGTIVAARQTGAAVVAQASTLAGTAIGTVSGGGTITLAYAVGSVSGGATAENSFSVTVTIVVTGTITSHHLNALVEIIDSEGNCRVELAT